MFLAIPKQSHATLGTISDGPRGIAETLKIMRQLVRDGRKSMVVRDKALSLIKGVGAKDWWGQVEQCHAWVRDTVQYVRDPVDVELVQAPEATLRIMAGDCDDQSTLLCALLESIGHPTRFVAIGFAPSAFEHVYCETMIGRSWVACETTEPWDVGQEPPAEIVKVRMYG